MQCETIYKGATRPAMKFGVPLVPLVSLIGSGMLVSVWGGVLISGWVVAGVGLAICPALAWMRFVTRKDDQRFHQFFMAARLHLSDRNHRFWHARSYSPTLFRRGRDGWHS